MNEDLILNQASAIFASEAWWKPVLGFIFTNCGKFKNKQFTHEEYSCFSNFKTLLTDLFDTFLCRQINVRPSILESVLLNALERGNQKASIITGFLNELTDFEKFRVQMINTNDIIDEFVTNELLALHAQQETNESMDDENADNDDVADLLEKGEQSALIDATSKKCQEMRQLLQVSNTPVISSRPATPKGRGSYSKKLEVSPIISPVTMGRPGGGRNPTILRPHLGK